jgi:HSP20 family molecular chaperone IbpA
MAWQKSTCLKPLYADVRSTRYRRSFAIGSELDKDKIEAALKDGVLR